MAASGTTSSRSGGYFKLYLFVWVVASAAALAYLASLLTGPDLSRALQQQAQGEPEQSTRLASRALSEVGNVRRSVSEIQRDVSLIREGLDQRDTVERQTQSRLSALEERVSGMNAPVASNTQAPAAKQKAVEKADKADKKAKEKGADRATSRLSRLENEEEKDPYERPEAERVETGSIVPPAQPAPPPAAPPAAAPTITFGAPVVTPTKSTTTYAVQIGAGSSREAIRSSWNQLTSKHASLQGLEPRIVAPKAEGGKYRLMAGPFPSKSEAERVCADMGVGRTGCFSTTFGGEPL
jgi:cell division protein FtsN